MKHRVLDRDLDDRAVRKHAMHAFDEAGPFHAAVEIVDHQEPSAQQVVAQPRGFLVAEYPAADFDGVDPRVVEQMIVHDRQRLAFVRGIDPRQALHALDQVLLGIRPIGEPAAATAGARADAGIGEPCEAELGVRIDGDTPLPDCDHVSEHSTHANVAAVAASPRPKLWFRRCSMRARWHQAAHCAMVPGEENRGNSAVQHKRVLQC